jgi:fluoroacetyl-CoA thioesterase
MELKELIPAGRVREASYLVEVQHTTSHIGDRAYRVLATPFMIGFMENNSHRLLAEYLPDGKSSVGVLVNVRHLAPTPLGSTVKVRSEVLEVDGIRVIFAVKVWDQIELVGEGFHERVIIDIERFFHRVSAKSVQGSVPHIP